MDSYAFAYKVALTGEAQTGKTSIMLRFAKDQFGNSYNPPMNIKYADRMQEIAGVRCMFQIWVVPRDQVQLYYKSVHGLIIIFDVTKRETFDYVNTLYEDFKRIPSAERPIAILVGNKTDQEQSREVTLEEAADRATKFKIPYMEVSALTGFNVNECFGFIGEMLMKESAK